MCLVEISKRIFYVNLLVNDIHGFNVILGMLWLSILHGVINCRKRGIIFKISNHLEYEFVGNNSSQSQYSIELVQPKGY